MKATLLRLTLLLILGPALAGSEASAQTILASGLEGASGSAIGPAGALYVTEGAAGRISRIDPGTGDITTFASGLPQSNPMIGIGGVMDVAFLGQNAYALVTLVGPDVGGSDVVGIYRIDGPDSFTVVADIGTWAMNNPPATDYFVPTGLQYSIEVFRGGFLVADGHHNRVLQVTRDGAISVFLAFDNVVPTGLAVSGNTVYVAQAGPTPHLPQDGRVMAFQPNRPTVAQVASGAKLLVDVEFGRGRKLYALSQGEWDGVAPGSPAMPFTGALVEVKADGTFAFVGPVLDRPTSVEFIGNSAYVVNLPGEVWRIDDIGEAPFGKRR